MNQQPRDGQRIPTLSALFQLVNHIGADNIQFDMETKINPHAPQSTLAPEEFVNTLLKEVRQAGMTRRVMVQSFDWRTLELLHKKEPAIRTMYLTIEAPDFNTLADGSWNAGHRLLNFAGSVPKMVRASAGKANGVIWAPFQKKLTTSQVKEAQDLGLQVIRWTVNQQSDMVRLMDWKVDGIITDYPNRLRETMQSKGLALPRPYSPGRSP
jgi:glycerophosphoryl diester phosphodiesterase